MFPTSGVEPNSEFNLHCSDVEECLCRQMAKSQEKNFFVSPRA